MLDDFFVPTYSEDSCVGIEVREKIPISVFRQTVHQI